MSKSKSPSRNDQRSNVKNSNNPDFKAAADNKSIQKNTPPPPPPSNKKK